LTITAQYKSTYLLTYLSIDQSAISWWKKALHVLSVKQCLMTPTVGHRGVKQKASKLVIVQPYID